ncbi:MAG: GDSL-type esterase/lipase family protein [Armatimonas sp.]
MELVTVEHGTADSQGHHFFPVPEAFATGEFIRRNGWVPPARERSFRLPDGGGPITQQSPQEFFTLRDGLGRAAATLNQGGFRHVAFVGGSITASDGWRTEIERWLNLRFPQTRFKFTRAGIPSLGSVPNSFRFAETVLTPTPPDLLFIEAAVNDPTNFTDPARMTRGMEGMVRQALLAKPDMDIALLHFAMPEHLADWRAGKQPQAVTRHEQVAERYGLPSLDLTHEVQARIAAGEFSWEKDFKDLHPSPFGHQFYAASIIRMLDVALAKPVRSRTLPAPIDKGSYFTAHRLPPSAATNLSGFRVDPSWRTTDGKETRPGFVDVPALIGEAPGAKFTLNFTGNTIGLMIASGPDAGQIAFSIDGALERTLDSYTPWSSYLYLPWALMLADGLKQGRHTLALKLLPTKNAKSTGTALRVLSFLVNG